MKLNIDQLRALEGVAWAEFERRLMSHWREAFPRRVRDIEDEVLSVLVRAAITEARKKGLSSELDIATYVDLRLALGANFAASQMPS
jgi:hypothetical protein